jgi:hypothetical protein
MSTTLSFPRSAGEGTESEVLTSLQDPELPCPTIVWERLQPRSSDGDRFETSL